MREAELDKIATFLRNFEQRTLVVTAPVSDVAAERQFLGYKFSKARGRSGIEILPGSPLYNPATRHDPAKISNVIRMFLATGDASLLEDPESPFPQVRCELFNDLVEYTPVARTQHLFPLAWNRTPRVPDVGDYVFLRDIVAFVESSKVDGSYVSVKIGDIANNRIKKTRQSRVSGTETVAQPGDILIPTLMPRPEKVVHVDEPVVLGDALQALHPLTPEIGAALQAYLSSGTAASYFYEQLARKLVGFKASYMRISPGELAMLKVPVSALGTLPAGLRGAPATTGFAREGGDTGQQGY